MTTEETEDEIMRHLAEAWNLLITLESTHPCHTHDFAAGIHKCQQIIMWRELQRLKPESYPIPTG